MNLHQSLTQETCTSLVYIEFPERVSSPIYAVTLNNALG